MRYTLTKLYEDIENFNEELEGIGSIWCLLVKYYSDVTWLYYGTRKEYKSGGVNMPLVHGTHRECLIRAQQFLLDEYRDKETK